MAFIRCRLTIGQPLFSSGTPGYGPMQCCGNPTPTYPTTYSTTQYYPANLPASSGMYQNGDVSWSPQFAFRSRFYNIFVLGRGLQTQQSATTTTTNIVGEKWLEAVYDGLTDQLIWQRTQVSLNRVQGLTATLPTPGP